MNVSMSHKKGKKKKNHSIHNPLLNNKISEAQWSSSLSVMFFLLDASQDRRRKEIRRKDGVCRVNRSSDVRKGTLARQGDGSIVRVAVLPQTLEVGCLHWFVSLQSMNSLLNAEPAALPPDANRILPIIQDLGHSQDIDKCSVFPLKVFKHTQHTTQCAFNSSLFKNLSSGCCTGLLLWLQTSAWDNPAIWIATAAYQQYFILGPVPEAHARRPFLVPIPVIRPGLAVLQLHR